MGMESGCSRPELRNILICICACVLCTAGSLQAFCPTTTVKPMTLQLLPKPCQGLENVPLLGQHLGDIQLKDCASSGDPQGGGTG